MSDFFDLTLLVRSVCDVALIGAFALAHFERGIRLRRSSLWFVFYWIVSLIAQMLIHLEQFEGGQVWVATAGTLSLVILVLSLILDLREHYRSNGYAKKGTP